MNHALPLIAIEGMAFWSSRLPGWDIARAVIRGEQPAPETVTSRPAPALLAPTERRRAPDTVAVALEVAARACDAAGRSSAELPSVFASTHGDLAISDYLCATLAGTPTLVSPIKFHNSVHNAAAGYWSIGTGSYAAYTAISAFHYTFGAGLLEAATQVACEGKPVLYVAFDIEAKGPLATVAPSRGVLGAALVLAPVDTAGSQRSAGHRLALQVMPVDVAIPTPAQSPAAPLVADNALAPCLPLFETLAWLESNTGGSAAASRITTLALSEHTVLQVLPS
jgi:Beta-ketoacyl synthase, N-terminal domain